MTSNLEQRIASVSNKAELLLMKYQAIVERCRKVEASLEAAEKEKSQLIAENRKLSQELQFMKIASTFVPQGADIEQSKKFLQEIVWDIDKCIKQLSE